MPRVAGNEQQWRKRVGRHIRAARLRHGVSQSELARRLPGHLEGRDVSRWERGANLPSWTHLRALARELDVSLGALLDD
jgi:transcriptional regulator with XRE-family HTH domain